MRCLYSDPEAAKWLHSRAQHANAMTLKGRVPTLQTDSRMVQEGDVFLAYAGHNFDARTQVAQALAHGVSACLVDLQGDDPKAISSAVRALTGMSAKAAEALTQDPRLAFMPHLKASRGWVAAHYHGNPSREIKVLAVTGTNGKTTCTWWLAQALSKMGRPCAVAGTLGFGRLEKSLARTTEDAGMGNKTAPLTLKPVLSHAVTTGLTTMEAHELQQALRDCEVEGLTHLALEASSIGLKEGRLAGTHIEVAVFTNLTQDHLDYHGDMTSYWQAKKTLFTEMNPKAVVINLDDAHGWDLYFEMVAAAQSAPGHPDKTTRSPIFAYTTAVDNRARVLSVLKDLKMPSGEVECLMSRLVTADLIRLTPEGSWDFELACASQRTPFELKVLGRYNVSNVLAVVGTLLALGIEWSDVLTQCQALDAVNGRMQRMALEGTPSIVIDYAHTPDALKQVLLTLKEMTQSQSAKLWCVMGCGGDRDRSKRALMGHAAQSFADQVVLTSDNPRHENPQAIMDDIESGMRLGSAVRQVDRKLAIEFALSSAAVEDWILVAGKGHETYQDVGGVRTAFSDQEVVAHALLQERAKRQVNMGVRRA